MRLAGKTGIVTAAVSGMGRAGALRFAREGAHVAAVDVDAAGVQRVVRVVMGLGLASQPDFWERVDALGEKRYYAPADMQGMP